MPTEIRYGKKVLHNILFLDSIGPTSKKKKKKIDFNEIVKLSRVVHKLEVENEFF